MRITYAEEEDFPGQAYLWESNLERSLKGHKGQQSLRELESALLALPSKRLVADVLEVDGDVCAIGALAKFKHYSGSMELPEPADEFDECATEKAILKVAGELGVPRMVAIAVISENDELLMTPERRYERMLNWTRKQLEATP